MGCGQSRSDILYSVPVTSPDEAKGESAIYRGLEAKDELHASPRNSPEVKTYQDLFLRSCKLYGHKEYFGTRHRNSDGSLGKYHWKTYNEVLDIITNVGSGIVNMKLAPPVNEYQNMEMHFVAVYAKNCEQWSYVDLASILYGFTVLPIYDTLGPEAVQFVFDQTHVTTIFCSNDHLKDMIKGKETGKTNKLTNIVLFTAPTQEEITKAQSIGLNLITYDAVIASGKENRHEYAKVTTETIYTFSYTSGTTGTPKAAMISHGNMVSIIASASINPNYYLYPTDTYISYLPLAHVLERVVFCLTTFCGVGIGFYSGDVLKLKDDLQELKPTIFVSVPRLFNKFYDAMKDGVNKLTGAKRALADKAIKTKLDNLHSTSTLTHAIYDKLVFKKMRDAMGGRVRFMLSGGAPVAADVLDFLKIATSCPIVEGYGQTESTAASFVTYTNDGNAGHVGGVFYCLEFKVEDVPEMNYFGNDKDEQGRLRPRGEVCVRGHSVFKGYYKDPEKTAEAIDKNGWLHTGDIGMINLNGSLKLIDRKKNIFKLAIGEYIAPEKIENIYVTAPSVTEAFVYGDSLQHFLVGIVVPEKKAVLKLAAELNISGEYEELCKNKDINAKILEELTAVGKASKLMSFEQVKKLHLEPLPFLEKGILTPAFKVKRHEALKLYKPEIDAFYSEGLPERK